VTTEDPRHRVTRWFRERSWVDILSYVLIVAGIFAGLSWHIGFLALTALGAFGPALLREWHVLNDRDELQCQASASAGNRAFLIGGLAIVGMIIARGWGAAEPPPEQGPLVALLCVMLIVYFLSYAFSFWDARRAATRVLLAFGLFWLAFVLLSHGDEPVVALIEALSVPVPFLLGAWLGRRWPRPVGILLVLGSLAAMLAFNLIPVTGQNLFVVLAVPLPLAIAGLALLGARREEPGS
jgi:hypothetical protein